MNAMFYKFIVSYSHYVSAIHISQKSGTVPRILHVSIIEADGILLIIVRCLILVIIAGYSLDVNDHKEFYMSKKRGTTLLW